VLALGVLLMVGSIVLALGGGELAAQPSFATSRSPTEDSKVAEGATQDDDTEQRVASLIQQLGSSSFAVRQSAVEQLWLLSEQAKPGLERAVAQGDSEVARRANEILSVLALGINPTTSPEVAKLVLHFHSSEQNVRTEVLTHLASEGEFQLVFDLLGQVTKIEEQRELFESVMDFNDRLIELARSDRWDDFEYILSHPITFEHQRAAGIHFQMVNGTLDPIVERLKNEIDTQVNDGTQLRPLELLRLIAILRLQGHFDEALQYTEKMQADEQRASIVNQILLEQGDWQSIAEKMARPEDVVRPGDGKIVVTPAQRALVNQFIGDQAGYQATVDELIKKAVEFEKQKDDERAREIRSSLIEIGLANLDWKLVESNLDPDDTRNSFDLYADYQRVDQAFEAIGLGTSVERRNLWLNRRIRNIKTLESKARRLEEAGQDTDEVLSEVREKLELCFQVTRLLGGLGLTDEAVLYYQTLFAALEGDEHKYRRISVVIGLIQLERIDEAWDLIENGFGTREYRQLTAYIFPYRQSTAGFWYTTLSRRYPNPLERLKVTSGIVNSPLGTTPDFDLQVELASAFSIPAQNRSGRVDYYLGKVFEFHGDLETSRRHLAMARELGANSAKRLHALQALEQGNSQAAIDFYDRAWLIRNGCFESALAAEAYRQSGDLKRARLRECLAYAFWRDAYRNTSTIGSFETIEKSYLIQDFLKLDVYSVQGDRNSNERFRDELAAIEMEQDPAASLVNNQLMLFTAAAASPGSRLPSYWTESRKQIVIAQARILIAEGKFQEALDILLHYNEFSPGDPDIGETLIAEFDRAGARPQADQLFEAITEVYFDTLERYPDTPVHHNNYAWICAGAGRRMDHMLRHIQTAVSQRPNSSTYLDTLAEVYFLLGETDKALQFGRRCLQINPAKRHYQKQVRRFEAAQTKKAAGQ
jgi:tetratricopeptide (TPR) repeat protein